MRGPNPSAVVVALSTVVAVSTAGFMVSVLGSVGGVSATLPIPGITGSAAPVADEVPGPAPVDVGPGGSEDAPTAGDAQADQGTPNASIDGGTQSQSGAGSSDGAVVDDTAGNDGTDDTVEEPAPTPVAPVPATPITPPKPTSPPSDENGKPDHANPGNGNGNGNGADGQSNKP